MKFAYLLMGAFDARRDNAAFQNGETYMIGVADVQQACAVAKRLCGEGFGCIELCGAFGEEGAQAVIRATENKIPVGFATHFPQQEELFRRTFPPRG